MIDDLLVTETLTIVGLGGSLARTSRSLAALRIALDGAGAAGAATKLFDLRELDLPMYNPDDEREPPPAASTLIEACHGADGMLWSSPMYQGTISGRFKNALDWLHALGSREPPFLHDEVIGLISAAGGTQGLQAINTMEFAVRALRGWAVPYVIPSPPPSASSTPTGRVTDEGSRAAAPDAGSRGRACRHSLRRPRNAAARQGMRRVGRARRCGSRLDNEPARELVVEACDQRIARQDAARGSCRGRGQNGSDRRSPWPGSTWRCRREWSFGLLGPNGAGKTTLIPDPGNAARAGRGTG
jgi:FMN reductase